jgi:hypothetical protein
LKFTVLSSVLGQVQRPTTSRLRAEHLVETPPPVPSDELVVPSRKDEGGSFSQAISPRSAALYARARSLAASEIWRPRGRMPPQLPLLQQRRALVARDGGGAERVWQWWGGKMLRVVDGDSDPMRAFPLQINLSTARELLKAEDSRQRRAAARKCARLSCR